MRKLNREPLRKWFIHNGIYFACFGLPAFIMLAVYLGRGVYPVADHSVLVLDLNAQFIYYYEAFRQAILEGKSLLYSWSQSLSGEMIGLFGYYLASPFMIVYLLFPKEGIVEALFVVTLLKAGTLGVTFAYFLRTTQKQEGFRLLIMSTLYALMAYTVVEALNPMWIDAVILLPLIALGIMRLVDEERFALFFVTLTYAIIVNYYIGLMLCVFAVLYFLYYYFSKPREHGTFVKSFLRFAGMGILCGLASAVIVIPVLYSLSLGKIGFTAPDFSLKLRYPLFNLFPKLLMDSYDSVNVQGLPMIYSGLLTLLLLPSFFLSPRVPMRKKIAAGGLIFVLFAIMNISILDIAMHWFHIPNWLNCRYSFLFSFVLLSAASEGFVYLEDLPRDKIIKTYICVTFLIVLIQLSQLSYINDFTSIWLSLVFVAIYALLLGVSLKPLKRETMLRAIAFVVIAELTVNTALTIQDIHEEVYYSSRSSYTDFMAESRAVIGEVEAMDDSFYRMEKTYHRTVNDPMALGFAGLSHSTSTLNARALDVIKKMGYSQREHWSRYVENSPIADSLFGFKYILSKTALQEPYTAVLTRGDITVYENPYALPIVFAANARYDDTNITSSNPVTFQNQLLSALADDAYVDYLMPAEEVMKTTKDLHEVAYGTHRKFTLDSNVGKIYYTVTMPRTGPLYACMQSDYTNAATISVNRVDRGQVFGHETMSVVPLGVYREGENVEITLTLNESETYIRNAPNYFYVLDMDRFTEAYRKLSAGGLRIEKRTETYLYGKLTASEPEMCVYTSIPYEGGWTIRVDGVETEVKLGADALVCFDIAGMGEHTIEMSYCPPGLVIGAAISGAALLLFAVLVVWRRLKKQRV